MAASGWPFVALCSLWQAVPDRKLALLMQLWRSTANQDVFVTFAIGSQRRIYILPLETAGYGRRMSAHLSLTLTMVELNLRQALCPLESLHGESLY